MDISELFSDDDAVSPVIGVILMVAITVILAAVIGAFVLDIGGSQEAAPQANWDFGQQNTTYDSGEYRAVTIEHGGGGGVDAGQINVVVDGTTAYGVDTSNDEVETLWGSGQITAGDSVTVFFADNTDHSGGEQTQTDTSDHIAKIAVGSSPTVASKGALTQGDTVEIRWTSSDGSQSQILGEHEVY